MPDARTRAEAHGWCVVMQLVVLSDRISEEEMDIKQPPIPTLLAVGSVHHHLIRCLLMLHFVHSQPASRQCLDH